MKITLMAPGSRGDVHPLIALGTGLKAAGHRVRLAAHPLFRRDAEDRGLAFFPIPALFRNVLGRDPRTAGLASGLSPIRFMTLGKKTLAPVMDGILAGIRGACGPADLILYNLLALPAAAFARRQGIPAWPVCLQPLARTRAFPSPLLPGPLAVPGCLNRFSHMAAEKALVRFFKTHTRLNGSYGLENYFKTLCRDGIPVINGFSPALVPKPADWGDNLHITGFWFLDPPGGWQPPPALADFLDAGPPPVCIGFGSMEDPDTHRRIQLSVAAVLEAGRRAVVLSGWSRAPRLPGDKETVYTEKDIPHAWLFPRVSAVIHHGGAGTTAAALRAGVPSIILPFFFDQRFWADRLHALGASAGPLPGRGLTVSRLVSRLETVLPSQGKATGEIHHRLADLTQQICREDGIGEAVALVDRLSRRIPANKI